MKKTKYGRCFSCQEVFLGEDMRLFELFQVCNDCVKDLKKCGFCGRSLPDEFGCDIKHSGGEKCWACLDCLGNLDYEARYKDEKGDELL